MLYFPFVDNFALLSVCVCVFLLVFTFFGYYFWDFLRLQGSQSVADPGLLKRSVT